VSFEAIEAHLNREYTASLCQQSQKATFWWNEKST